jgi:hypothetical protein|tara:strand:+ start:2427 stop:2606 length:180 start_codon:yes stop_codon:yes gene_type:complete
MTYLIISNYTNDREKVSFKVGDKFTPKDTRDSLLMKHLVFMNRAIEIQENDIQIETKGF